MPKARREATKEAMAFDVGRELRLLEEDMTAVLIARQRKWKQAGVDDANIDGAVMALAGNLAGLIAASVAREYEDPVDFVTGAGPLLASQAIERAFAEIGVDAKVTCGNPTVSVNRATVN